MHVSLKGNKLKLYHLNTRRYIAKLNYYKHTAVVMNTTRFIAAIMPLE